MVLAFDQDIKDRVRLAVSIVDLIGSYSELRRQGRGFVARCPFHDDQRPSLQVNPDRQSWRCFVCGIGGDIFSFVMRKEGVEFPEAIRMLADRAGIALPERRGSRPEDRDRKRLYYRAMEWAIQQYRECFSESPEADPAREYMTERGLTPKTLQQFAIGYAPDHWTWIIDRGAAAGYSVESLETVGLLSRSDRGSRYDRFRGRVLFPILDPQGRPIAIGGRVLPGMQDDAAKYINCNETPLYQKSHQLYGLSLARDEIRKTGQAIVMEGYTDVMMAFQHGVENAVACCGTAIGLHHIQLLKRHCDQVILVLDGDEAGQRRTNEVLELFLEQQMDLRILSLPDGLDPCDFLQGNGGDAFRALAAQAVDALEHKIRTVCRGFDPLLDTHRAHAALEDILQAMAKADSSTGSGSNRLRRDQIVGRLARQFGIDSISLKDRVEELRTQSRQRTSAIQGRNQHEPSATNAATSPAAKSPYRLSELTMTELEWFEIMTLNPEFAPAALERFTQDFFATPTAKALHQLFVTLEHSGHSLDFSSILAATDDLELHSVLVAIDVNASEKAEKSILNGEERLNSLIERWTNLDEAATRRSMIQNLSQRQLGDDAELALLKSVLKQAQIRHGIVPAED